MNMRSLFLAAGMLVATQSAQGQLPFFNAGLQQAAAEAQAKASRPPQTEQGDGIMWPETIIVGSVIIGCLAGAIRCHKKIRAKDAHPV